MTKTTHQHVSTITEVAAFFFLSTLVLLGGISIITVQAQYATAPIGSGVTTNPTTPGENNAPSNTASDRDQCPTGFIACEDDGCYPAATGCPGTTNTNSTPTANTPTENSLPASCPGEYAVAGTQQCNYTRCSHGCTYGPNNCPTGCRTAPLPQGADSQPSNTQPGENPTSNTSASDAANTSAGTQSNPNPGPNSPPPGVLLTMNGIILRIEPERLLMRNSETGAEWRVITTNETIYSVNGGNQRSGLALQQAIKVFYAIAFANENVVVARGISTLSYTPANTPPNQPPAPTQQGTAPSPQAPIPPATQSNTNSVRAPLSPTAGPDSTNRPTQPNPPTMPRGLYPIPAENDEAHERNLITQLSAADQVRFLAHCRRFGVENIQDCRTIVADNLDPICRERGAVTPEECDTILRERHTTDYCATNNIQDPAACRRRIIAEHENELLCGDTDRARCRERSETLFIGHITAGIAAREAVAEAVATFPAGRVTIPEFVSQLKSRNLNPALLPVADETQTSFTVLPSEEVIDVSSDVTASVSIPYVIIPDADGDGLSDDLEATYGTDPNNADSDNDGFTDAEEIKTGHDPLQPGVLQPRTLQATEQALIDAALLQQPAFHGATDTAFTIEPLADVAETKGMTLRGTADPNAYVLLYVYSKLPMVLTVKTDEFGNWVYELQENLVDDRHTVYVAVTDKTGRIVKKSNPLSFLVNPAIAVTRTTFLTDEQLPQAQSSTNFGMYYLLGGALMVAAALILVIVSILKRTNHNA